MTAEKNAEGDKKVQTSNINLNKKDPDMRKTIKYNVKTQEEKSNPKKVTKNSTNTQSL